MGGMVREGMKILLIDITRRMYNYIVLKPREIVFTFILHGFINN